MLFAVTFDRLGDLLYDFVHEQGAAVLAVALVYLLIVTIVRWRLIAWPVRGSYRSDVAELSARLQLVSMPEHERAQIAALLADISPELLDSRSASDWLLWGRGYESEAAYRLCAAERLLCRFLPEPEVDARLRRARPGIAASSTTSATALVARIDAVLDPTGASSLAAKRALLELTVDASPTDGVNFVWHRKSMWLMMTGLVFAVVGAFAFGHAQLLFFGAFGAFLSRVWRAVRADETPQKYWAYWYTLFLAPVAGAFAAFGGLLILEVLRSADLLGTSFDNMGWSTPSAPATLGIAFLLGFSERLLDRLAKQGEQASLPTPADSPDLGETPQQNGATPQGHAGRNGSNVAKVHVAARAKSTSKRRKGTKGGAAKAGLKKPRKAATPRAKKKPARSPAGAG